MYEDQMDIAFAGMKVDLAYDNVESLPVGAAGLPFGRACGTDANGALVVGAGTVLRGVSLHSHTVTGNISPTSAEPGYQQYDCASVHTHRKVWVRAVAPVTIDGPASFNAQGIFSNAGTPYPTARFRSALIQTAAFGAIACVEISNPTIPRPTAP